MGTPKLFPLPRKDCAIARAGDTSYSMPIVNNISHALEINKPIQDRAYDFLHIVHLVEDVTNRCLCKKMEE